MKKHLYLLLWLFAPLSLLAQVQVTKAYIQQYKDIAIKEMKRTGIPASITLAQAIVESSSGESNLAKKFNNHFGIKCKLDWKGETTFQDDDTKKECFRVYPNAMSSFKDHSDFLKNRPNYASLFELDPVDDTAWAYGLKKAGYATANDYPKKLLKVIDDYELSQYNYSESTIDTALEVASDTRDAAQLNKNLPNNVKPATKLDSTLIKDTITNSKLVDSKDDIQLSSVKGLNAISNNNTPVIGIKSLNSIPKDTTNNTIATTATTAKSNDKVILNSATEKNITNKIITDTTVTKKTIAYPTNQKFSINQVPAIWAQAGRSFLEIADTYHISLYKMYQFNDLKEIDLVENDQIIFLAAKKKESERKVHPIKKGETLYDISQSEGIQLEALKAYNPTIKEDILREGSILYLFKMPVEVKPITSKEPTSSKKANSAKENTKLLNRIPLFNKHN